MHTQHFFIISALITRKIEFKSKTRSVTKRMVFTGTCSAGKPLFSTDEKQAFPFLKESAAEIMAKCLNEPMVKISQVGTDYGVTRQEATDVKQGAIGAVH